MFRRVRQPLVLVLCALIVSSPALSQTVRSAYELMQDMMDSSTATNYSGFATHEKSGRLATLHFTHLSRSGQSLERIARLDGPVDSAYYPRWRDQACGAAHESVQMGALSFAPKSNLSKLAESYSFEIRGQYRVANRLSTVILLNPKDQFRLPHLISIDNQSDLMLKSVILDNDGKPLERLQFVNLQIGGELDTIDIAAEAISPCKKVLTDTSPLYQPSWVPPGYALVFAKRNRQPNQAMMTFSDGLASFSLFVASPEISTNLPPFSSSNGATSAVSIKVDMGDVDLTVSVVGEISKETAERIARSVMSGSEIRSNS